MFFVVPSVTLLSLKYIYIWKKKQPFKQIMFRFAGFPMNFPYKSKNLQGELQCCWLNHVESLYSIVKPPGCCWWSEKSLFCCMFGHHVTGPKTIPPQGPLGLPICICQDLPRSAKHRSRCSRHITRNHFDGHVLSDFLEGQRLIYPIIHGPTYAYIYIIVIYIYIYYSYIYIL